MRPRPLARRLAFQYLFVHDLNRGDCPGVQAFLQEQTDHPEVAAYAETLVEGYRERAEAVDAFLERASRNFSLERIAAVERNILRLAASEMLAGETPFKVVIDEAIKLARKFGGADSTRFVNGILDTLARETADHA